MKVNIESAANHLLVDIPIIIYCAFAVCCKKKNGVHFTKLIRICMSMMNGVLADGQINRSFSFHMRCTNNIVYSIEYLLKIYSWMANKLMKKSIIHFTLFTFCTLVVRS